jgi:hypothetical protein
MRQVDLLDWAGLAATMAGAALLYTLTGFGFAVLAAPLFLLFVDPPRAIQLVIVISISAVTRRAAGIVTRDRTRAVTPAGARQSGRVAGRPVLPIRFWFAHWSGRRSSALPCFSRGGSTVARANSAASSA